MAKRIVGVAAVAALALASEAAAAPTLAVALPGGRTAFPKGAPVAVSVTYREAPPGASVVLELVADTTDQAIRGYAVAGPLGMASLPLKRAGRVNLNWDGKRVACAPTDVPVWCDGVDVGRYRIRASVYDYGPFGTVGWPPRRRPKLLAQADSPPFYIEGQPDLRRLERAMGAVASRYGQARLGINRVKTYAATWGEFTAVTPVVRRDRRFCRDYNLAPPATGRISVCAPDSILTRDGLRAAMDDMTATGWIGWRWGVVDYTGAVRAALAAAAPPYLARLGSRDQNAPGPRGTYLSDVVQNIRFRTDLNAWLVEVVESEAGGTRQDRISDLVLVRVDANRRACVVSTHPYQGPRPDIRTVNADC